MRPSPRIRLWLVRAALITLVVLPLLYGVLRTPIAHALFAQAQQRAAARGLTLRAGRVAPYGFLGMQLDTVLITAAGTTPVPDSTKAQKSKPDSKTPKTGVLLRAGRLSVALRLRYALVGEAVPAELELFEALAVLPDSTPRPAAEAPRAETPATAKEPAWGSQLTKAYARLAPLLSTTGHLRQVHLLWGTGANALHLEVDSLRWGSGRAAGRLAVNGVAATVSMAGDTLVLATARAQLITAPPLKRRLALSLGARELRIHRWRFDGGKRTEIELGCTARELTVMQHRLSRTAIVLPELQLNLSAAVGPSQLLLDSSSRVQLNGLSWQPYVNLDIGAGSGRDTLLAAYVRGPDTTAQAYLDALTSTRLFSTLQGLRADGRWRHEARVAFDSRRPDTLAFTSALNSRGFRIRRFGAARLTALADSFTHRPPGTRLRVLMGPANPEFVPLAEVPAFVADAVLTSEDPAFRWHRGFSEQAIGESILQNYRQGRFARGGSTISMQLMKNIYLSGEKNLARKLEEALLVWMLEDGRLVSKERLLEIYLNLIEWAPNRYGIRQAADFYFAKTPDRLELSEAVLLAMIIPRPKRFYIFFNPDGTPRPQVEQYRKLIVGLMLRRSLISEDQAMMAELLPPRLGPAALDYLRERYAASPAAIAPEQQLDLEYELLDEPEGSDLGTADSSLVRRPFPR